MGKLTKHQKGILERLSEDTDGVYVPRRSTALALYGTGLVDVAVHSHKHRPYRGWRTYYHVVYYVRLKAEGAGEGEWRVVEC